jgi:hypothetical protein
MKKYLLAMANLALLLEGCNRAITGSEESGRALAAFNAIVKANQDRRVRGDQSIALTGL